MKKLFAILICCLPALGQATYSGHGLYSGSAAYTVSGGSPLTYNARIDNCVHGFGSPYAETGCVSGRTTGQAGSGLVYQEGSSDPVPFLRLDDSSTPAVVNTTFTDPDFGSYSVFATDYNTNPTCGANCSVTDFIMGSDGGYDAFGIGTGNDVLLSPQTNGSIPYFLHIIESRVLAHACSPSNPCIVQSNIVGTSGCIPSSVSYTSPFCTHTQMSTGSIAFSRNSTDPPNTIFELAIPYVYKDTWTSSFDINGMPTGVSDSVTRTLYVDLSSDSSGAIPCSIVPTDYVSQWNGVFELSDRGAFTIASAGGPAWHSGATYGPDTFIQPVNNITGIQYFMFQATTAGTSGSTEPAWSSACAALGNTCSDGSVTWTNIGKAAGQGPGFDIFHFDPVRGCRRMNTRLTKTYNGTNEGPSWPSTGTADAAGQWITDDATVCNRMGGSNCGIGGTVNLTDVGTIHGAGNYLQSEYGHFTPTGAGKLNQNFVGGTGVPLAAAGNGSCTPPVGWTAFASWPNSAFASGSYSHGSYVSSPVDHNYYQLTGASGTYTTDPSADSANWGYESSYCYNYIIDWYSNIVRPDLELGPHFGGDSHASVGYGLDFRGGKYYPHILAQPNCQNTFGACAGQYVGAPNPGVAALTLSLPSDGHPTYRNDGTLDLQPIFDPTTAVPSSGGVGVVPSCGGGTGVSGYCAAGFDELIAFSTDGLQTLYRFGHNYNTGSNPAFGAQNAIGVISQDGKMLAWTGDFMNTRGDHVSGSATCSSPSRAQYQPSTGGCVTLNDNVLPITGNLNQSIYKITSTGSATQGSCGTGQFVEGTVPAWSACQGLGTTCTDGNVVFTNQGPNSCRSDIAVMDVTSAHQAP